MSDKLKQDVNVMEMGGKKFKIQAQGNWTIKQLKQAICQYTGQRQETIKLLYKASILSDEKLVRSLNLKEGKWYKNMKILTYPLNIEIETNVCFQVTPS